MTNVQTRQRISAAPTAVAAPSSVSSTPSYVTTPGSAVHTGVSTTRALTAATHSTVTHTTAAHMAARRAVYHQQVAGRTAAWAEAAARAHPIRRTVPTPQCILGRVTADTRNALIVAAERAGSTEESSTSSNSTECSSSSGSATSSSDSSDDSSEGRVDPSATPASEQIPARRTTSPAIQLSSGEETTPREEQGPVLAYPPGPGSITIYPVDLRSLEGTRWLTDAVMDAWARGLEAELGPRATLWCGN
ncbi:putative GPI-anchored protein pfl2 [Rhagoletis pomonella]|uniref:putative GPI-anchored protein pfl2 n=1 Tax=Rhagoletis pomonella TaxID=28610 RepID=UPI00177B7193|nr:putative GPI-anchored protein pfl2 [Rhagoletis pomonella]